MKIRALVTIQGAGDKRASPKEVVDTKFLGIGDEEARVLILRGFAEDAESKAPPKKKAEKTEAADSTDKAEETDTNAGTDGNGG